MYTQEDRIFPGDEWSGHTEIFTCKSRAIK